MKSWFQDNAIEIYLTVVAERFIRSLESKIYKHMPAVSKNVHIHKLYHIANKHNNTYHRKIKLKLISFQLNKYIDFEVENSKKDPKFKVNNHVTISRYKNIFALKKFLLL